MQNLSYFNRNRASAKMDIIDIYTRIDSLVRNIIVEINNEQSRDEHILRALLYEMLMFLNREYLKSNAGIEENSRHRHIDRFMKLVDENFRTHHDTKYYADRLCITPNYLNEVVQQEMKISPKCYIPFFDSYCMISLFSSYFCVIYKLKE